MKDVVRLVDDFLVTLNYKLFDFIDSVEANLPEGGPNDECLYRLSEIKALLTDMKKGKEFILGDDLIGYFLDIKDEAEKYLKHEDDEEEESLNQEGIPGSLKQVVMR